MPKRLAGRTITAEDDLADRLTYERERRGWSYERLATSMTEAGCKTHPSAIHKIEKGEPRRRITVTELVGISRALDVPVEDLLRPLAAVVDEEIAKRDADVRAKEQAALRALRQYQDAYELLLKEADIPEPSQPQRTRDRLLRLRRCRQADQQHLVEYVLSFEHLPQPEGDLTTPDGPAGIAKEVESA